MLLIKELRPSLNTKQITPKSVENDIRPISLTNQVAKIMEGFTLTRSLPGIYQDLDCK